MSANATVRADWASYFEAMGMRTRRCMRPEVRCALLGGKYHSALHDEADFALYDHDNFIPELRRRLLRTARLIPIAVARDPIHADGRHVPVAVEVIDPIPTPRSTG